MTTLNSTSILALIIARNPYHIISIQGQMPMSHAQNTYDFEIAEDEHFPTPGKPNPNYYTDSGATFNKHLRTQNKLKQKRK